MSAYEGQKCVKQHIFIDKVQKSPSVTNKTLDISTFLQYTQISLRSKGCEKKSRRSMKAQRVPAAEKGYGGLL